MSDEPRWTRLRDAGTRFRAADQERHAAMAELKAALAEADGDLTDEQAGKIAELPPEVAHMFKLQPGD